MIDESPIQNQTILLVGFNNHAEECQSASSDCNIVVCETLQQALDILACEPVDHVFITIQEFDEQVCQFARSIPRLAHQPFLTFCGTPNNQMGAEVRRGVQYALIPDILELTAMISMARRISNVPHP